MPRFRTRHDLSWLRVTHSPFLAHWLNGKEMDKVQVEVSHLDTLQGVTTGTRQCIFGTLAHIEEGSIYLEDAHAVVKLDISCATTFGGYFGEGMVIVAEGAMDVGSDTFVVDVLGHPPPESRDVAFCAIGGRHMDVFPNDCGSRDASCDAPWLFLASCYLDSPATLPRLRSLLAGLVLPICRRYVSAREQAGSTQSPKRPVVVFMGNFLSPSGTSGEVSSCIEKHSRQFAELGACVCSPEFYTNGESLATLVDFVFVPGPHDLVAGSSAMLPRAKLLQQIVQPLVDRLGAMTGGAETTLTLTTSPARFRYGTGKELAPHRDSIYTFQWQIYFKIFDVT